jgi:hypothetical protein
MGKSKQVSSGVCKGIKENNMKKSICERCFHYDACSAVDVTGVVGNPECEPENQLCDYFIDRDRVKIQDKAHWIEEVKQYKKDGEVFITHYCSHCNRVEKVRSYSNNDWKNYYNERYREGLELSNFCRTCGSIVEGIFEKEE